jgi:hypothetical protein
VIAALGSIGFPLALLSMSDASDHEDDPEITKLRQGPSEASRSLPGSPDDPDSIAALGSIGFPLALLSMLIIDETEPVGEELTRLGIMRMTPKSQNFGRGLPRPRVLCLAHQMTLTAGLL